LAQTYVPIEIGNRDIPPALHLRGSEQAQHGRSAYVVSICPVCQFDGGGQEVMARRSRS
jgi:hypothetical protein